MFASCRACFRRSVNKLIRYRVMGQFCRSYYLFGMRELLSQTTGSRGDVDIPSNIQVQARDLVQQRHGKRGDGVGWYSVSAITVVWIFVAVR